MANFYQAPSSCVFLELKGRKEEEKKIGKNLEHVAS
jgi:hypothetical protein